MAACAFGIFVHKPHTHRASKEEFDASIDKYWSPIGACHALNLSFVWNSENSLQGRI